MNTCTIRKLHFKPRWFLVAFILTVSIHVACTPKIVRDPWDHSTTPRYYELSMITTSTAAAKAFQRGCDSARQRDFANAEAAFLDAFRYDPELWEAKFELARIYRATQRYDEALEILTAIRPQDPETSQVEEEYVAVCRDAARYYQDKARESQAAGDMEECEHYLKKAREADPGNNDVLLSLGNLYNEKRNSVLAAFYFQAVLSHDPSNRDAAIALSELYLEEGNSQEASILIEHLASQFPDDQQIQELRARIEENSGSQPSRGDMLSIREKNEITRADCAVLIQKILQPSRIQWTKDLSRKDPMVVLDVADHWAYGAIREVLQYRLMMPYANHTFRPDAAITRADLAEIAESIMTNGQDHLAENVKTQLHITDVATYHAQYNAIRTVVSEGLMVCNDSGEFHPNSHVSGIEAITVLEKARDSLRKNPT